MAKLDPLRFGDAAESESSGRRWKFLRIFLVAGLPVFWVAAIILSQTQRTLFLRLTREDGVVEVLQIVVLVAAAIVTGAIAWRLSRRNEKRWGLLYAGVTLGLIFIAAEEISWGQRAFGVAPSGFFDRYNKQGETNLHNLKIIMPVAPHVTSFILIVLIALSARSLANRGAARIHPKAFLWMPPAVLLPAWLCYASYRAVRTYRSLAHIRSPIILSRLEEPAELIFYTGLLAFALIVLSRLPRSDDLESAGERISPA